MPPLGTGDGCTGDGSADDGTAAGDDDAEDGGAEDGAAVGEGGADSGAGWDRAASISRLRLSLDALPASLGAGEVELECSVGEGAAGCDGTWACALITQNSMGKASVAMRRCFIKIRAIKHEIDCFDKTRSAIICRAWCTISRDHLISPWPPVCSCSGAHSDALSDVLQPKNRLKYLRRVNTLRSRKRRQRR